MGTGKQGGSSFLLWIFHRKFTDVLQRARYLPIANVCSFQKTEAIQKCKCVNRDRSVMLPSKSNREPTRGVHTISGSPAPGFCPREPATQHPPHPRRGSVPQGLCLCARRSSAPSVSPLLTLPSCDFDNNRDTDETLGGWETRQYK